MSLKVMTVVGTRPEIIRLSAVIRRLDRVAEHVLVHTGQNHDPALSDVFFRDLGLRAPDHHLGVDTSSLATVLAGVLTGTERLILERRPDALLVLGDTNSCIAAFIARRMKVPVFHMEAGNRSFDPNVPEEVNRRLVDHVSDYNLAYTEHSRRHLLAEGVHPSRVVVTGSPMGEVLAEHREQIEESDAVARLGLAEGGYVLASVHREENVDDPDRLAQVLAALGAVAQAQGVPVVVSTHPRTRRRLESLAGPLPDGVTFHEPLGFLDYNRLQLSARCVVSDSGTIAEESAILGFPAVTIRDAIERPEAIDAGTILVSGLAPDAVVRCVAEAVDAAEAEERGEVPEAYQVTDCSRRAVRFLLGAAETHRERSGVRTSNARMDSKSSEERSTT